MSQRTVAVGPIDQLDLVIFSRGWHVVRTVECREISFMFAG